MQLNTNHSFPTDQANKHYQLPESTCYDNCTSINQDASLHSHSKLRNSTTSRNREGMRPTLCGPITRTACTRQHPIEYFYYACSQKDFNTRVSSKSLPQIFHSAAVTTLSVLKASNNKTHDKMLQITHKALPPPLLLPKKNEISSKRFPLKS